MVSNMEQEQEKIMDYETEEIPQYFLFHIDRLLGSNGHKYRIMDFLYISYKDT